STRQRRAGGGAHFGSHRHGRPRPGFGCVSPTISASGAGSRVCGMSSLRDATAEAPAPVRAVAQALSGYIDRLGTVWVEGQVAQVSRRPGLQTVFMTLRDTIADLSLSVTCPRHVFDSLNPPLVEGASVVVHAKPSFYAVRGTLSLQAR